MAGDFDESAPTAGETIAEQRIDALDKMRTDLSRVRAALEAAVPKDWNNVPAFNAKAWNRMVAAFYSLEDADDFLASAIKNLTRAGAAPSAPDVEREV